jgi:hypothetical protein
VFCYYEQAAMQVDQRSLIDAKTGRPPVSSLIVGLH